LARAAVVARGTFMYRFGLKYTNRSMPPLSVPCELDGAPVDLSHAHHENADAEPIVSGS